MSVALAMAVVPLERAKGRNDIILNLPAHAKVRAVAFATKKQLVVTAGKPSYADVPVAFIEVDPLDNDLHPRRFLLVPTGATLTVPEGQTAEWCATGFSPDGVQAAHLFEIVAVS